jgi:hypothetical protein
MLVTLKAGEHLWGSRGSHVCDEKGFAVVLDADIEVEIDDDVAESALAVIRADREFRGCDPLTGEPLPVVEPVVEPTPEALPQGEVTNGI